jgi:hypothetical protein
MRLSPVLPCASGDLDHAALCQGRKPLGYSKPSGLCALFFACCFRADVRSGVTGVALTTVDADGPANGQIAQRVPLLSRSATPTRDAPLEHQHRGRARTRHAPVVQCSGKWELWRAGPVNTVARAVVPCTCMRSATAAKTVPIGHVDHDPGGAAPWPRRGDQIEHTVFCCRLDVAAARTFDWGAEPPTDTRRTTAFGMGVVVLL